MWEQAYTEYLAYEKCYSPETITAYVVSVRGFDVYLQNLHAKVALQEAQADHVREWLMLLMDEGKKAATVNRELSALKNFYRYLKFRGQIVHNPTSLISGPKKERSLPVFAREQDMRILLEDSEQPNADSAFEAVRDRMIVLMFYATGMRRAELLGLRDEDVDMYMSAVKVTGKRDKQRVIPFADSLMQRLRVYLVKRDEVLGVSSAQALFVDERGRALSPGKVGLIVKTQLAGIVALKKRSPHVLRHTFATAMLNNGAELNSVKALLGHASLSATEVYTHLTFEELKKVYNQAHPRA